MNIAIFTDTYSPDVNGVAKTLQRFTDFLELCGHNYKVFAPKSSKTVGGSANIYHHTSIPFLLYPECRFSIPNWLHVKAELKQFAPDIIHVATPFSIGLCGIKYAQKFNIPLVGSYHTDFDKYLTYYKLGKLSNALWKYLTWFHRPMEKIFVPSLDTLHQLKRRGFNNLEIWERGIDRSQFHSNYSHQHLREKYQIKEKYILSYVGRLSPEKDIPCLVNIIKSLPIEVSKQIHWLIVGDGPLKQDLTDQLASSSVTLTGYLHGKDLATVYAASDLFVFPSSTETFGNVVLEALASGTPAIGANAGGVKHIIQHNKNGMLCNPLDTKSFMDAITSLLTDEKKRRHMSENAIIYAQSKTWNHIFHLLLSEYEDVIMHELQRKHA
ncbi:glycosyltransferase family 1 protein [Aquibacillus koreensis]|uniref:Glycosyltransferase family 1 protein n=1 Tax=Aquibacillus koreensis TaxID=279446 RepID=A0A9X3WN59_9BACI|nr:glycosyltransferase family 1 protein [Aquibacillus koreensis]MCT2535950.1 glycosyltransferase family 1 protein [Aquibacillus koreensis]MDC3420406.1 glycosyltransferase family 1 protein [Aquibacillus koreensis]